MTARFRGAGTRKQFIPRPIAGAFLLDHDAENALVDRAQAAIRIAGHDFRQRRVERRLDADCLITLSADDKRSLPNPVGVGAGRLASGAPQ